MNNTTHHHHITDTNTIISMATTTSSSGCKQPLIPTSFHQYYHPCYHKHINSSQYHDILIIIINVLLMINHFIPLTIYQFYYPYFHRAAYSPPFSQPAAVIITPSDDEKGSHTHQHYHNHYSHPHIHHQYYLACQWPVTMISLSKFTTCNHLQDIAGIRSENQKK